MSLRQPFDKLRMTGDDTAPQAQDPFDKLRMTEHHKIFTVAIADDHKMIRELVVGNINALNGFKVVLEAADGKDLVEELERLEELPDICIIDISMPVMNGYEAQVIIKKSWPQIKCLAISIYDEPECIVQMLRNGADGFISKQSDALVIQEALAALCTDGCYYGQIKDDVLREAGRLTEGGERGRGVTGRKAKWTAETERGKRLPELTDREKEYLTLTCQEFTMEEISTKLGISIRTLEHYRDNVYRKLNVNNKADLIFYVNRTGIVYMK